MTNEKILTMINNNKIEELKRKLIEEIELSQSKNKNTTKAIIQLSKQAEKDQKTKSGYVRPNLAGAWEENGKQYICNGFFAVKYNNITNGTINIPQNYDFINVEHIFEQFEENTRKDIDIDLQALENHFKVMKTTTKDTLYCKLNDYVFNVDMLLKIAKTFDNVKFAIGTNVLFFTGDNGNGILLSCREVEEKSIIYYVK